MHLVTMLVFLQSCAAFTVVQNRAVSATVLYAEYVPLEGEGKLNLKVRITYRTSVESFVFLAE